MISNKYINAIIATITAIAVIFTTLIYVNSNNITNKDSNSATNFPYIDTVFNKEKVTEIDLEINEDTWNSLLENAINEEYVNANITVNGTKYNNVGIRTKGNSSLSMIANDSTTDRYSFKVKFDEYVKGQTLDGLSKIALNNVMSDATYMKEYLSYDLLDKMGVPTPAFAFTNIKVNGEEWGVYFAVEVIEEEFIERNYGSLSGNLYKPDGNNMNAKGQNNENMNQGMKPDMNNVEDGGNMAPPDMNNSQGGNNMVPPNMDNPQGGNNMAPPNMDNSQGGNNMTPPNMDNPPGGNNMAPPNMDNPQGEDNNTTENNEGFKNNGFRGGMIGGGMGSSNGSNLVYTDDNKESYSDIFDSKVFKTTTEADEDKVIEMIKNLNEGTNLEEYLNVDEILRYFAVNTFLVNLDSYASNMKHNYYLYEKDGVFEIIPWDYNLSFGAFNIGDASEAINFPIDSPVTDTLENSPLIGKLLEVDEYKEAYHKYLQEIVNYINNGNYENTIDQVNSLISEYVKNDATAFYTYEEYTASLPELKKFGIDRAKSISAQLDGSQPSTSYGNIETSVNLSALGSQGMGMNNKNMDMQRPNNNPENDNTSAIPDKNNQQNQMNPPNMDNNVDSTTSASIENNDTNKGDMQKPNNNNENFQMNKPNTTNEQAEMQKPKDNNINPEAMLNKNNLPNNQENLKLVILKYCGYFVFLVISIIFVALFKRKKFKAK